METQRFNWTKCSFSVSFSIKCSKLFDFNRCVICQEKKKNETVVKNPGNIEKLLIKIKERASYGNEKFALMQ